MTQSLRHREHVELVASQSASAPEAPVIVAGSWRRCITKHHLNPDEPPSIQVLESRDLNEHRQRHDYLMGVAQQELVDLYNQMQGSGYSIFLTDTDGIVLQQVCDPNYVQHMRKAGLRVGANWSEQANGTNGIGTCIVEQRPLTIHLEDHFHTKHTLLSCSAAPIRDPSGELLAVLDSSAARQTNPSSDQQTLGLVRNTASFIEGLYFLRLHRSDIIIHLGSSPDVVPQPRNPMIAVTADGRISGANERALLVLGVANRQALFGRDIKHLFDLRDCPINSANAGQIKQLRLIERGKYVYATWQASAPKNIDLTPHTAPIGSIAPVHVPLQANTHELGHSQLETELDTSVELLEQNIALLLQGETGTGKDTIARALHDASRFKHGPFVTIDCCTATAETLRALHPDHINNQPNTTQCPAGGSLFLNNANLMPEALQAQLLELLNQCERNNQQRPLRFNLLTACRNDLHSQVGKQLFREDLFYRLAQYTLNIPPLRERNEKHRLLDQVLQNENARQNKSLSLSETARERLLAYSWPGNIRELQSTLRTAVTLCRDSDIQESQLPEMVRKPGNAVGAPPVNETIDASNHRWTGIEAAEYELLLRELRLNRWNISATAKKINMSRNTIYRKMQKYQLSAETDGRA